MLRVDAHHHLWRYDPAEFDWLTGDLAGLRRDFGIADLQAAMRSAGVAGAVAVQARQSVEETDALLEIAASCSSIWGVVGWLPLRDASFDALLERYRQNRCLKGLRHVVQAEAPGYMDDAAFRAGIAKLAGSGLVYDLLILESQMEEALRLVKEFPQQMFVLDHIGKPRIAAGDMQPWTDRMRELARCENLTCKVSGMVTEADALRWAPHMLRPYFDVVLEAFGPSRLMVGTDWPVLLAGCTYSRWWDLVAEWTAELSKDEQADVMGGTAARTYGLQAMKANNTLEA